MHRHVKCSICKLFSLCLDYIFRLLKITFCEVNKICKGIIHDTSPKGNYSFKIESNMQALIINVIIQVL